MLAGLLLGGRAHAGACCVGTTSTVPTRLGECEHWLAGMGMQGESTLGLWDSGGTVTDTSMTDEAMISTMAMAWRWDRRGQLFATLPARVNHRVAGDLDEAAAGLSDLRGGVIWDPIDESPANQRPIPVITLGARLPTGVDWTESETDLQTDVTGLVGPAIIGAITAERTMGRLPWSLGADVEASTSLTSVGATAAVGRYLNTRWSLNGSLRYSATFADGATTARTNAGLKLTRGQPLRWRGWVAVDSDVPLDGLGQSTTRQAHASLGVALIR
ncbi:MAG: hypothetical protein ACI8RZ_006223 [Myxococcota bacterium]|jgi:hypothetical protein